jgi:hypothetical protein
MRRDGCVNSASDILAVYSGSFTDDPGPDPPQDLEVGKQIEQQLVDGARFILDQPSTIPAVWGEGAQVLWAEGEALMIAGGQGLGKTTLAG